MTTHLTLRLAWHNDGWNGRICQNPQKNTYCVGCSSYPGEMVRETRDLEWEIEHAGEKFADLSKPPACMYSGSAFADQGNEVLSEPPSFFKDDTRTKRWTIPAATACTWPYEAMYNRDDIRIGGRFDYEKRLRYSEEHFSPIKPHKSLVFYYANYSNPLSEDENPCYLLVGVARIKQIAPTLYYEGCSEQTLERYKGFVWQRGVTSHYPEQGLRLPYHRYLTEPDMLHQFAAYPEDVNVCKYATKQVSDDDALGLLERLLESLRIVRDDVRDDSENWTQRIEWVESLISELWQSRGAYPGMPAILEVLDLKEAISGFRQRVEQGEELSAVDEIRRFCSGEANSVTGYSPPEEQLQEIHRDLKLGAGENLSFLLEVLSRVALDSNQIKKILSEDRQKYGLEATLEEIEDNPYILAEQFVGKDANDVIRWSVVDRGMLPSPELPVNALFRKNSRERLRAFLLETLRSFKQQTFVSAKILIDQVNRRVRAQPDWKQNLVTEKYLSVDREFYDAVIYQRIEEENYLYDIKAWEDEQVVRSVLEDLLIAPELRLEHPVTEAVWHKLLYKDGCPLAQNAKAKYDKAIKKQKASLMPILHQRLAVITGGAGTGKSTAVAALIRAIRKAHGEGTGIAVLAPTGKATDRLRRAMGESDVKGVYVATIHSLLASRGWLNDNLTLKRRGGKRLTGYSTLIVDESSMIDLTLMAALFRGVDWSHVSRLILVGDAAQLPPIGIGKVYADILAYLRKKFPQNYVELTKNLRQMLNHINESGCGILDLASCFINSSVRGRVDEVLASNLQHTSDKIDDKLRQKMLSKQLKQKILREQLLRRLQEGGDVDKDLRVVYWRDQDQIGQQLIEQIVKDFTNKENENKGEAERIGKALKGNINAMQVLSPVRGELYGTEHINQTFQRFKSDHWLKRGTKDGIAMFDKVIQIKNVQKRFPLTAYNFDTRKTEEVQVFNGEIGSAVPTGNWQKFLNAARRPGFRIGEFSVQFTGKKHLSVNYCTDGNSKPETNLELAYAISVHKAQGSEFERVYFVLPANQVLSQIMELIYTALTRASMHCTIFVQNDIGTLIDSMRPEQSALTSINSSLFEFRPVNELIARKNDWYEAGKIHESLANHMVRSKSEVLISNMLHERNVTFYYEKPLVAKDGSMYLPDFTLMIRGEEYYWEHLGLLDKPRYKEHWEEKRSWYENFFPRRLVTTEESRTLSRQSSELINRLLSGEV